MESEKSYQKRYYLKDLGIHHQGDIFPSLALGLYQQLSKWTSSPTPIVTHRLHRRNLESLGQYPNTVGWFAGDIPLLMNTKVIKEHSNKTLPFTQVLNNIPMGGVGYEILAQEKLLPFAYEISPVRLNYQPYNSLGQTAITKTHLFEPPEHKRLYLWDLIVRKEKENLLIIARYSNRLHRRSTIKNFVEEWMSNISKF